VWGFRKRNWGLLRKFPPAPSHRGPGRSARQVKLQPILSNHTRLPVRGRAEPHAADIAASQVSPLVGWWDTDSEVGFEYLLGQAASLRSPGWRYDAAGTHSILIQGPLATVGLKAGGIS